MTYQICSKITFYFLFVIVIIYSMYLYIAYEIKDDEFKTFSQISCLVVRCGSEILQIKIHMHSTVD